MAHWVHDLAAKRTDAEFELVDLKDFNLPNLDEAMPAVTGEYGQSHTQEWAAKIASFDAYVFVTPEYNHSTSGVLKTRSTSSTLSGTTKRPGSSAMAWPVAAGPWSTCD